MVLLLRELESGPATSSELAYVIKIARRNVNEYLRLLRRDKRVRVCAWERRGRPVYCLGSGRDAPRAPLTQAQMAKRSRARRGK